jgi:hypothetical protein
LADEDDPRGYFEFEPVKNLLQDSKWLFEAQGKAVKIAVPLLAAVPRDLACRVILCERDLDEVPDSQERMLARRNQAPAMPRRRRMLKEEYVRTLSRAEAMLARRPRTQLLAVKYRRAISDSRDTAEKVNRFFGRRTGSREDVSGDRCYSLSKPRRYLAAFQLEPKRVPL